ncbi:hypothetical protein P2G88_18620 [Aliiglaciecola sp. CAU 1673]|uniref:hypothetical protein n=1 Tax=Aliiglaciecola sp. CAU 1673 TaxID=3032595 RepID=UPI0023DA1BDC|nr:hypothetical protein [Aliiglaciecola sp. CAU 1673]MDF2180275.1 hypothetical protein [Aliiglaciecola sp. CAU 1673]
MKDIQPSDHLHSDFSAIRPPYERRKVALSPHWPKALVVNTIKHVETNIPDKALFIEKKNE